MNKVAAAHHPSYVIYVILVVFLVSVQFFKFGSFLVHLVLRVEWQVLYVLQFITLPVDCYKNVYVILWGKQVTIALMIVVGNNNRADGYLGNPCV